MTFLNSETASSKSFEDTSNLLKTNLLLGLNESEIIERRKLYSFNEFDLKNEDPFWLKYLEKVIFKKNLYTIKENFLKYII